MRSLFIAAAIAGASLAGAPAAFAQPSTEAPPAAATASAPPVAAKPGDPEDPGRLVCKKERITGTNRREKVCMTVAERDRLRDAAVARGQNNRGADYNKCIGGPGR